VFPILHVSYGFGFLRGGVDHLLLRRWKPGHPITIPLSR
jgi:hypothetical protein